MFNLYRFRLKCSCGNSLLWKYPKQQSYSTKTKNLWKPVIGLEVHAQIISNSKLFSGAKCDFAGLVNDCVSPFDASIPGTLPVLNKRCVEAGVLAALALSCKINPVSSFDRKHYFYADLPSGYQITQQRSPIAQDGFLQFQVHTPGVNKPPYTKISKIKQIQLEQDSGKSLHDENLHMSLVDLNRAGIPLIEVVFEPDLEDAEEAASLVKELIMILDRIRCCSGRMEEGALRVDANVSIHRQDEPLGTRTEIKNIYSVRAVANAINHEIARQIRIKEEGGTVINETRSWDAAGKVTVAMRDKEIKQDYRYMPEPNLPPLRLNMNGNDQSDLVNVVSLREQLPELPEETRQKLMTTYGLSNINVIQIVNENTLLKLFLEISRDPKIDPKKVVNILLNDFLTVLNKHNIPIDNFNVQPDHIGQLIHMREGQIINIVILRNVLEIVVLGDTRTPEEIVQSKNWQMINDPVKIEKLCTDVMNDNPKAVQKHKDGNKRAFNFLTKKISQNSNDLANMAMVANTLTELLKK
ncbi:glutamyl-tRNA(Gln) amidotransferase subunit B, mitochondrial [Arctopsyche grandis]|uniref:glutamyl-tRNA(Gln) amidotransferase subunit B, mitochondrial n=1 Tax=Arctopsyche grandis TaxID=121162 RepID=UPI00406D9F29